jgi:hypothetical protein
MDNISDEFVESIIDEIELTMKFKKLSNEDLVKTAITEYTDFTWHPVVEEMMNRLSPEWDIEKEDKE